MKVQNWDRNESRQGLITSRRPQTLNLQIWFTAVLTFHWEPDKTTICHKCRPWISTQHTLWSSKSELGWGRALQVSCPLKRLFWVKLTHPIQIVQILWKDSVRPNRFTGQIRGNICSIRERVPEMELEWPQSTLSAKPQMWALIFI